MSYKLAIFDLDGTLLNTTQGILECVENTAKELGFEEKSREVLITFIGPPLQDSFQRVYGCDREMADVATAAFRKYYSGGLMFHAEPYEGIFDLCERLKEKGIRLAVATYKKEEYAKLLLQHFGFDKYMDVIRGADKDNQLTKSDIIGLCIKETGVELKDAVLIGDTLFDAKGANDAGVDFLAVTYGFGFRNESEFESYPYIGAAGKTDEIDRLVVGE